MRRKLDHGSSEVPAFAPGTDKWAEGVRRLAVATCLAIPLAVLVTAYAWLALEHGTLLLWHVVVHESGRYTLGETVLYFGHFLREVPIAVAYALFLLTASGRTELGGRGPVSAGACAPSSVWVFLLGAAALVGVALLVTARQAGPASALQDLLQYRTRDDLAGYGTHWRYHWLSTLWFGAMVAAAPAVMRRVPGLPELGISRFWTRAAWGYFLALTLIFGMSADIFLDARYAGHQAREIMTHGPVTLLLGIGILLAWSRAGSASAIRQDCRPWTRRLLFGVVFLVPVHLSVIALSGDVMAQGQSELGLSAMVAAHFFEHSLDYMLVLLLLLGGLASSRSRLQPGRQHATSVPVA
jgi:hypothetical protein